MGDGSLLLQCGDALRERGHTIRAVVTGSEQVAAWARGCEIPVVAGDRDLGEALSDVSYDWFFSIANLRLVPDVVWQRARKGSANFHDGPLPRYAGLNAPAWAILGAEKNYGVTWHAITSSLDEGDIYAQSFFDIEADDTSLTLNTKCFEAGIATFQELLARIESDALVGQPQNLAQRTYYERHKRPDRAATLDFSASKDVLGRLGRSLSFGAGYANPLCLPKVWVRDRAYTVLSIDVIESDRTLAPGVVISVDADSALVACADGVVKLGGLSDHTDRKLDMRQVLRPGQALEPLPADKASLIDATMRSLASNEAFFERRLRGFLSPEIHGSSDAANSAAPNWQLLNVPSQLSSERLLAAILAGLARMSDQDRFDVMFADDELAALAGQLPGYVADTVPLSFALSPGSALATIADLVRHEIAELRRRVGVTADLIGRLPRLTFPSSSIAVKLTADPASAAPVAGSIITFVIAESASASRAILDASRLPRPAADAMMRRLAIALAAFAEDEAIDAAAIPLATPAEQTELLEAWKATDRDYDRKILVHTLIEAQVRRTPDAVAVVCGDQSLTYRALDERANRVARQLVDAGVGPDMLVGLKLKRSCDLVVGALAVWKAGGAYVPLDPAYPVDRLALVVEDSGLSIIIADHPEASAVERPDLRVLSIDGVLAGVGAATAPSTAVASENLAYVIYTSGSTGRPKGVLIEHRNVVNFFAGMDDRIPMQDGRQPVWLAVTSLSFDISVLELFWTLTRGFKVVIFNDARTGIAAAQTAQVSQSASNLNFGLFYWGDDDSAGSEKYRLLLEGARFADTHGFNAVWTPERHFHAFGGPYPNPAVTGAAVAAITRNVSIRGGSCVLPLHHPARVAEEWSIVDNISQGRIAIAFASGWMPEDFLLRPQNAPPANKAALTRDIEVVRRLWRGDKVAFDAPNGKTIEITTLPRPVQKELPVWLTTAGNADSFREAARLGANILTHLLGQTIAEVGEKIRIYREALAQNGHDPSKFTVTLMLHTLIGSDREAVREMARGPMTRYLRSAAALIKDYAWAFPAFKRPAGAVRPMDIDLQTLEPEEMDAVIDFAFQRYFDDSGLFGTIDDAITRANQLAAIGVDEIACLIDFGVKTETALASLQPLADVVGAVHKARAVTPISLDDDAIGNLIERHGVTHLQCTPSMATMMLANDDDRIALRHLKHIFLGGEALQAALLKELRSITSASIDNMYGPTETTIWSSTGPALDRGGHGAAWRADRQYAVLRISIRERDSSRADCLASCISAAMESPEAIIDATISRASGSSRTRSSKGGGCIAPAMSCAWAMMESCIILAAPTIK